MYCMYCRAELANDANFCIRCGKPQKPSGGAQEPEAQWETLEVECRDEGMIMTASVITSFLGQPSVWKGVLVARAFGPEGDRVVAEFEFIRRAPGPVQFLDSMDLQEGQKALSELDQELRAAGWQRMGNGPYWYSARYRRRFDPTATYRQVEVGHPSKTARKALDWSHKGETLLSQRRTEEALAAYEHALALDPKDVVSWNQKGYILQELGRHEEALTAYDHALALDPRDAAAWFNKGGALYMLGDRYEEALAAYDRALSLGLTKALVWNEKGNALRALGRNVEALAAYNHALALDANYVVAQENKESLLQRT